MLPIFEPVEDKVSDQEKDFVIPLLLDCLLNATQESPINANTLSDYLRRCEIFKHPGQIRKLLSYAVSQRIKQGMETNLGDKVIVAHSKGFFLTHDKAVIQEYVDQLSKRVGHTVAKINSLKEELK